MKIILFIEKYIVFGVKMYEFVGYNMFIEYLGIIDEYFIVCNGVGVFDVLYMGEFWVKGFYVLDFL